MIILELIKTAILALYGFLLGVQVAKLSNEETSIRRFKLVIARNTLLLIVIESIIYILMQ